MYTVASVRLEYDAAMQDLITLEQVKEIFIVKY